MIRYSFLLHSQNDLDADVIRVLDSYPRNPRAEILRRWIALSANISGNTTYKEFLALYPYIEDGSNTKLEVRCCRELPETDSVRNVFKEVADLSYKQRENSLRGHVLRGYLAETSKNTVTKIRTLECPIIKPDIYINPVAIAIDKQVATDIAPVAVKQRPDMKGLMGKAS